MIENELDKFDASMDCATQLDASREELYLLYGLLAVRLININLLNKRDNGWYVGDQFIGTTTNNAYWAVVKGTTIGECHE